MKKFFILIITMCFLFPAAVMPQTNSKIPDKRILNWSKAGLLLKIPPCNKTDFININDFIKNDSTFDKAFVRAIKSKRAGKMKTIYFPEGRYLFTEPLILNSNVVLRGDGAGKSHIELQFKGKRGNGILFSGKPVKTLQYKNSLSKGINEILLNENIDKFNAADIVEIYQGKTEWGKSSSGKQKQCQKGQVIKISAINGKKITLTESLRLTYPEKDRWGEPIIIRLINAVVNSGIENLSIERKDKPPKNGGSIISFQYAHNCWLSGVKSRMGANHHVSVTHSANIEVRGSVFNKTFNSGGGGNGYGIVVGGNTTDCLFEDNIFTELRHAMIIATGANGNVFGYNASFNKPISNMDEASISIHGHYPYMNLFESNYVEYIDVDYVWGSNGEYNTFLRNYVYHSGVLWLFRNQQLQVERGTDKTNIIGNLANISAKGDDNFILKNMPKNKLNNSVFLETFSFYHKKKPDFIPDNISWPCFGLKTSADGKTISNTIPAVKRFRSNRKTVSAKKHQ